MNPWNHTALRIRDAETELAVAESQEADEKQHADAVSKYRSRLLEMRSMVERELARLPEPPAAEPVPEKVAGHISDSLHA